jgi:hypothetical protein
MQGILKYLILALFFTGPLIQVRAQSAMDLRINEILVYNDSNYVDDYGIHSPWIEIFNSAYNSVNIGGLFLTDDLSYPRKYMIPKGQQITVIPTRSYLVFWADSNTTRGILHLNFTLNPGKTIALFDANGKTLIDSVSIPLNIGRNVSFGRLKDGLAQWAFMEKTTPNSNNDTSPVVSAGEEFKKYDPLGGGMAVIAMGVVFTALALLFILFKTTARILKTDIRKQLLARAIIRAKAGGKETPVEDQKGLEITGEINAAIAMTLYLYSTELHDAENTVLTINKVSRTYSPWSSKIYGINIFRR